MKLVEFCSKYAIVFLNAQTLNFITMTIISLFYWIYGWLGKIPWKIITKKEDFYSHLNMEGITDVDYVHTKRVCKDFEIKIVGEYHDFFVQTDTLLPNVFEKFRNMYLNIYKLYAAIFL